jgi:hypothetical protein
MRSRIRPRAAAAVLSAALLLGPLGSGPSRAGEPATRGEVNTIVEALRADPDLKTTRRAKVLRLKPSEHTAPQAPRTDPSWWTLLTRWTGQAFAWLAETTRWLIWLLGALAVALIAVSMRHWIKERADAGADLAPLLPSHIGLLDVRPESLPERIGAHAGSLWQSGEHRAALSLLYRGALSRLIHAYGVPIRAAHTESECVRLAQDRLQHDRSAFFTRLVSVWQSAVYGGHAPEAAGVLSLCDQFDVVFGSSAPSKVSS